MGEKDIIEKTLEAYNDVFADIVNGFLFQGKQVVQEAALSDAQPFSMYKEEGQLREQERDVAKYWQQPGGSGVNVRIAHLPEEAIGYFHSDFKVIVDYFIHKRENPDYRPTDPVRFNHVDELLKLMSAVTRDERFVQLLEAEGGKPKDMCEVLDRAEARGEERGIAIGEAKGIEQTRLENIKNVMEGLKFTAQQAMNLLKIPVEEQSKYLSML